MALCSEFLNLPELRHWLLLVLGTIGAVITIRTYINSTKQRRIDNTFKTLDFLRRHIGADQIATFITLFQANNEISGAKYSEFKLSDGRIDTIEYMFSEGGCGNGDIHNMIELFNTVSPTIRELDLDIIWYEYGQIMTKIYQWTKYLEDNIDSKDLTDQHPTFYYNFNRFMKGAETETRYKPFKYYTYAE